MHDIHAWTAAMLPDLLKQLHDRGFKVVHMVPKGQIETISSYDEAAQKALAAKAAAKAANPMASRAIVWPMSPTPEPVAGTDVASASLAGTRHKTGARLKRISTKPSIAEGVRRRGLRGFADANQTQKGRQGEGRGFPVAVLQLIARSAGCDAAQSL